MDRDTVLLSFTISSLVIAITLAAIYTSFGPSSKDLIDPFEEDKD
jgi:hypothetical protein